MKGTISTPADWKDDYPHGIKCAECDQPLSRANVAQIQITEDDDEPRLYVMLCVVCALTHSRPEYE